MHVVFQTFQVFKTWQVLVLIKNKAACRVNDKPLWENEFGSYSIAVPLTLV
jgi:hypothetical protein